MRELLSPQAVCAAVLKDVTEVQIGPGAYLAPCELGSVELWFDPRARLLGYRQLTRAIIVRGESVYLGTTEPPPAGRFELWAAGWPTQTAKPLPSFGAFPEPTTPDTMTVLLVQGGRALLEDGESEAASEG